MTRQDLLNIGFKELPHFTVIGTLIFDIGRNRRISIGSISTPNEMTYIYQVDPQAITEDKVITDLVCLHNYDYDGYLTLEKVKLLISFFKSN